MNSEETALSYRYLIDDSLKMKQMKRLRNRRPDMCKATPSLQRDHVVVLGDGPVELDELIAELESVHGEDFLADARKWAAVTVYGHSNTLASLRLKAGLSQAQLASRMNMTQSQLAHIERGKNDIPVSMAFRIAQALGL
ncbi:XRE family transcriptional regulator [Trinickia dinghuensis]|uniref:XRE family transcriptional regulator n=1 Tax=Trinickia dinghuensis TaxID=2291023 RepID=A0A3D8JU39_9BURK|nr:XRE family transcriptional regulator [Trinickia dinghuensis]